MAAQPKDHRLKSALVEILYQSLLEIRSYSRDDADYCIALASHGHDLLKLLDDGQSTNDEEDSPVLPLLLEYWETNRPRFVQTLDEQGRAPVPQFQRSWKIIQSACWRALKGEEVDIQTSTRVDDDDEVNQCPVGFERAFLEILSTTFAEIQNCFNGDNTTDGSAAAYCFALADHAHNIPHLLDDARYSPDRLLYYWNVSRQCFLEAHPQESDSETWQGKPHENFQRQWQIIQVYATKAETMAQQRESNRSVQFSKRVDEIN